MNAQQLKETSINIIKELLDDKFSFAAGETINEEHDAVSAVVNVNFEYGNCKRNHHIYVGWNEDDGIGIEYGEDSEIMEFSKENLFSQMYYELALDGLADEFLH